MTRARRIPIPLWVSASPRAPRIPNNPTFGGSIRALLLIKVSGSSDTDEIIESMKGNERICNLYTTVGNYDIISTATCPHPEGLSEFIDRLRKIDGIAWIDSVMITSREKVLKKILKE